MSGDEEFDDFLARRKPLFQRPRAHELEPPADVDRLVLRQAREAIRPARDLHEIRGPGWGVPLAMAATVLVTVTIVLNVMVAKKVDGIPQDVHQVAQRLDSPATEAAPAPVAALPAAASPSTPVVARTPNNPAKQGADTPHTDRREPAMAATEPAAGAAAENETARVAASAPAAGRPFPRAVTPEQAAAASAVVMAPPSPSDSQRATAKASASPAWRHDAQSWLAEIDKLRAQGKNAEADAEMAEYKREHRAYASGPDR